MSVVDEVRKLFGLAERDLARMEAVHDNEDLDDEAYGFFAQQAVEKGLKAALTAQSTAFGLVRLFDLLPAGDPRLALKADLAPLFPYAVEFRYDMPQPMPVFDRDTTRDLVRRFLLLVKVDVP